MNGNKKLGFTLIELLAVIVVLAIILAIAIPGISGVINNSTKGAFRSDAKMVLKAIQYKLLEDETFDPLTLNKSNMQDKIGISGDNYTQVNFAIVDNNLKVILVGAGKWDGLTAYGTSKSMNVTVSDEYDGVPPVLTITDGNNINTLLSDPYIDAGATATDLKDGDLTSNIVKTGSVDTETLGSYTITYSVEDNGGNTATATRTVNVIKEGNAPVLATGMTPIKWNGTAWVITTADDIDWYNYNATDKKWANARTADGSMWVWVPRYIYRISSEWHTNTVGTIDVMFSVGTDDTRGGTVTLDTGITSNASNNKWTNHPTFTFGTTELTGIWVAKFEVSGTTSAIDVKPNVASLRSVTIGDMFTAARNMETNSRYGWGTTGTGVDTHLPKNIEWGATVYLAKSIYGKTTEPWKNNSSVFTTGCTGNSIAAAAYSGCENAYDTVNGQKASTTGNIYGIYDMSGGAYEYVAAYVNNGNANLTTYGTSILSADLKYKDVYAMGASDTAENNYVNAINKKGDAIYETSNSYTGNNTWDNDTSYMLATSSPWFFRGRFYNGTVVTYGMFLFYGDTGYAHFNLGFRAVLLVGSGL